MAASRTDDTGTAWLIVILMIAGAWWFSKSDDTWEGFVYPDRGNLTKHYSAGVHKSLDECRAQATYMLRQMNATHSGDYECGLNCREESGLSGMKICKETER